MPFPVARCNNIICVKVMRGIRVGVYMAMRDIIMVIGRRVGTMRCWYPYWAWAWHGYGTF